jgi:hypothetical protein
MPPSAIAIPPPVPAVAAGALVGPTLVFVLELALAIGVAALAGVLLGHLRDLAARGHDGAGRPGSPAARPGLA